MSVEREKNDPPIVDPKPFLEKPFTRIEIGLMPEKPTIDFLRWLTTISNETGLVYVKPKWAVIKSSEIGIPGWTMPHHSDILLHSHPQEDDEFLPSSRDFLNCSPTSKNFLVSPQGLTQFYALENPKHHRDIDMYFRKEDRFIKKQHDRIFEHLSFLESVDARYTITQWDQLNQEKLDSLFYG